MSQYWIDFARVASPSLRCWWQAKDKQMRKGTAFQTMRPAHLCRDLKLDNVFINAHNGVIKIGDLGLATCQQVRAFHSEHA